MGGRWEVEPGHRLLEVGALRVVGQEDGAEGRISPLLESSNGKCLPVTSLPVSPCTNSVPTCCVGGRSPRLFVLYARPVSAQQARIRQHMQTNGNRLRKMFCYLVMLF